MKHVIITMSLSQWQAIRIGKKTYECRKNYPRIPAFNGRVYVVLKGTNHVAGYFTLDTVIASSDARLLWFSLGEYLAIDEDCFVNYAASAKGLLYLWHIHQVYSYHGHIDLEEYFAVKHKPKSFIYTNKEPQIYSWFDKGVNTPGYLRDCDVILQVQHIV